MSERLRDSVRYSRRHFAAVLGASTVGLSASWVAGAVPASIPWPTRQSWLTEALRRKDSAYDPLTRMLVAPAAAGPGYPAVLRPRDVHSTRLSLAYAAALLDTGEAWRVQRAREILGAVIPLQDQAPGHKSSGQWPWCLEEPLQNQTSIDWDDLCPTALLTAWMIGRHHLRGALEQQTRDAIEYAARQPREPELTPAHRAIMQVGFVVLAVQELQLADLRVQARGRLRRLYEHLMRAGSFDDYNSPSDSLQVLQELSRMLALVRDARDKALIRTLHDLAWKHVAAHFHAPSQQWAGPHSYNVETDLKEQPATLAFLQRGCGELAHLHGVDPFALSLEAYRLPLQCPRKWARAFGTLEAPRQTVETFALPDPAQPGYRQPITGTTWLHPRLTIGSVNRGDFWKHRRPLLAYWGTPQLPRFLRARFLKDDHDFSSALLFSVQHQSHVLAAVVLSTDHGDDHPGLEPVRDVALRARTLRFAFEFGGSLGRCTVQPADGRNGGRAILVQDDQLRIVIQPVADAFGSGRFEWDQSELGLARPIYARAPQSDTADIALEKLGEVFLCFALSEWPYDEPQPAPAVQVVRSPGRLQARWAVAGKTLDLQIPTIPAPFAALNDSFQGRVV